MSQSLNILSLKTLGARLVFVRTSRRIENRTSSNTLIRLSPNNRTLIAVAERITAYNPGLGETLTTFQASTDAYLKMVVSPDYTSNSLNSSFFTYQFTADDLSSLDCFHPSIHGQKLLACLASETWQGDGAQADYLE
jgi:hypothetical protein